ncbi:hypothetical protein QF048_000770 [Streptomyces sp. W4I9-2]|nr:hypothetical protein [Streptomyces sp. W4I9-2]
MSRLVTRRTPSVALISSASSYVRATPSAISSNGQPWEPTWACSRVSHGRSRKASTIASRAPGSRSATPNFDVSVAVLIGPIEPPPT